MQPIVPNNMKLRDVRDDDHEWLVALHNDPIVLNNLTDPTPVTMEHHIKWWNLINVNPKEQRFIFDIDGERVGFTKFYSIDRFNKNCVLGADIYKDHRGKGYAKHMWSLMLDKCFYELDLYRASLLTADFNLRGHHIYTKLGFKEEGRLYKSLHRDGVYHDQICMYILYDDWRKQ